MANPRVEVLPTDSDEETVEPTPLQCAEAAKNRGNEAFRTGEIESSIEHYSEAISLCPEEENAKRAVYHANRAAAYLRLDDVASAIEDCTVAIEADPSYRKAYLRRAHALLKHPERPHFEEALSDLKHLAALSPPDEEAVRMLPDVERRAEAERERLKTEMLGQLKDLGNTFLGWFGMSTDNFKAEKDPATGQYSIQFVQNAPKA